MNQDVVPEDDLLDLTHLSPLICMELAAGLSTPEGIRAKYGITEPQWERLRVNETFTKMMREAELAFSGDLNAGKRITKKAEILLEESLPILHKIMSRKDASTQSVVDVVKQLIVLAGRTAREAGAGVGVVGPGFNVSIQINTSQNRGTTVDGEARLIDD